MAIISAFSKCITRRGPPVIPPGFIKKYNPGYYLAPLYGGTANGGISNYSGLINYLTVLPNALGFLHRINWREIETSFGVYDFTVIDQLYNDVISLPTPKRLCLLIELRSTSTGVPAQIVPNYVVNNPATYGGITDNGGTWNSGSSLAGNVRYMNTFNSNLLIRLKAFSDALKAHLNDLEYFEMLQFSEYIVGSATGGAAAQGIPSNYQTAYPAGLFEWVTYTNSVFTKTIVSQLCNFPQSSNGVYIPQMRDLGIGVSTPNSIKDHPGIWVTNGIWWWYSKTGADKLQNVTVICPHIQKPECYYSNLSGGDPVNGPDGLGVAPSPGVAGANELADFVRSINANYCFITKAPQEGPTGRYGKWNSNGCDEVDWKTFLEQPLAQIQLNTTRPANLP